MKIFKKILLIICFIALYSCSNEEQSAGEIYEDVPNQTTYITEQSENINYFHNVTLSHTTIEETGSFQIIRGQKEYNFNVVTKRRTTIVYPGNLIILPQWDKFYETLSIESKRQYSASGQEIISNDFPEYKVKLKDLSDNKKYLIIIKYNIGITANYDPNNGYEYRIIKSVIEL